MITIKKGNIMETLREIIDAKQDAIQAGRPDGPYNRLMMDWIKAKKTTEQKPKANSYFEKEIMFAVRMRNEAIRENNPEYIKRCDDLINRIYKDDKGFRL